MTPTNPSQWYPLLQPVQQQTGDFLQQTLPTLAMFVFLILFLHALIRFLHNYEKFEHGVDDRDRKVEWETLHAMKQAREAAEAERNKAETEIDTWLADLRPTESNENIGISWKPSTDTWSRKGLKDTDTHETQKSEV